MEEELLKTQSSVIGVDVLILKVEQVFGICLQYSDAIHCHVQSEGIVFYFEFILIVAVSEANGDIVFISLDLGSTVKSQLFPGNAFII